jgi:hypothetical protein
LEGRISRLPLDKENKLKEGDGRLTKEDVVFFFGRRRKRRSV